MKKNKIQKISGVFLMLLFMVACEQKYDAIENSIYLGEAQNTDSKNVTIEDGGANTSVYLSLAAPVGSDVKAKIAIDSSVLEAYNQKHGTSYQLLPESYIDLENNETTIKAGKLTSPMLNITIKPFDEKLQVAEKYAIPIKVASAEGVGILSASSCMVILCDKVINTNVLFTTNAVIVYDTEEGDLLTNSLDTWTVEFLIYSKSFARNKHLLCFENRDNKSKNNLFARFGEFDHPINEIQFSISGYPFYGAKLFDANKWHHVALVNDGSSLKLYQNGVLDFDMNLAETGAKFNWTTFYIQNRNPGALSEYRLWGIPRKAAEIANSMYAVNPQSAGLISYWKMDDGAGSVKFKDYTGNGRDLTAPNGTWKSQKFPPEE